MNEAAVKRLVGGLPPCSTHTGAYCQARQRLPVDMVSTLVLHTGEGMSERAPESWRWRERPVRLVDGTTVVMPDTPANQSFSPQPRSQKPGLGFPLCRMVGILCLGSGAVLNAAIGSYHGKGGDEQALLRTQLDTLQSGDLLLGDAYSCCVPCGSGGWRRSSNNTGRASAAPTFVAGNGSAHATI